MALKTIETKAIISAADQTGTTFAVVAQKLKHLENAAASAGGRVAAVGKGLDGALARSTGALGMAAGATAAIGGMLLRADIKTYENVDDARRAVKALTEQTEAQSLAMLHHALNMGLSTRFGAKEVEESYKELAGRIHSTEVIESIVDVASQLAMALGSDLPTAVKVLENTLFATGVNVENAAEGLQKARLYSAQLMKMAKLGGFTSLEDVAEAVKFPSSIASVAGVSLATEGALLALMKRGGQQGPEAGVAMRQFVAALAKPTQPALTALDAAGIHYKNYVTGGKHMSAADLNEALQRKLGKKLSPHGLGDVQGLLDQPELSGDQAKFTAAAMERLGKGLKPQDARQITKVLEAFWQASIAKVDIDRLLHDIIGAKLSPTQLIEIFGSKQGARFATAGREGLQFFEEKKKEIENVPLDYPERIAKERMAGFAGAMARLNTAMENLGTTLMAANDRWVVPLVDEITKLINDFSNLDSRTLQVVSAIGAVIAPLAALKAVLTGLGLVGLAPKGGGLVGRSIGALGSGVAGAIFGAPMVVAGGGLLASTSGLNVGENEIARQRKRNLGAFRWLGNEPPVAGKFTKGLPFGPVTELKGSANVDVRMKIELDEGLIAREIQKATGASGDVGVSMQP